MKHIWHEYHGHIVVITLLTVHRVLEVASPETAGVFYFVFEVLHVITWGID